MNASDCSLINTVALAPACGRIYTVCIRATVNNHVVLSSYDYDIERGAKVFFCLKRRNATIRFSWLMNNLRYLIAPYGVLIVHEKSFCGEFQCVEKVLHMLRKCFES